MQSASSGFRPPTSRSDSPEQSLDRDLLCIGCGYNLRGLKHAGHCPECGAAIERSVRGDRLQFANVRWVARLSPGAKLLALARLGELALVMAPLFGLMGQNGFFLALAVAVGFTLLNLFGAFLITTAEPGGADQGGPVVAALLRWATTLGIALLVIAAFLALFGLTRSALVVAALALLAYWTGAVSSLVHLRRLALRLPDARLAWSCRAITVGFAVGALTVGGGVIPLVAEIPSASQSAGLSSLLGLWLCAGFFVAFITWLWWASLLFLMHERLSRAASQARRMAR